MFYGIMNEQIGGSQRFSSIKTKGVFLLELQKFIFLTVTVLKKQGLCFNSRNFLYMLEILLTRVTKIISIYDRNRLLKTK